MCAGRIVSQALGANLETLEGIHLGAQPSDHGPNVRITDFLGVHVDKEAAPFGHRPSRINTTVFVDATVTISLALHTDAKLLGPAVDICDAHCRSRYILGGVVHNEEGAASTAAKLV